MGSEGIKLPLLQALKTGNVPGRDPPGIGVAGNGSTNFSLPQKVK